jgi:hypothetical protein
VETLRRKKKKPPPPFEAVTPKHRLSVHDKLRRWASRALLLCSFHLDNLSISHVLNAAKHLKEKWGHTGPPTIIIDANWVACRGAPTSDAVAYTIDVICALKVSGFCVLIWFWPSIVTLHKSCIDPTIGEREAARADAYNGRTEIMRIHVSEQLLDDNLSPDERDSLETVRKKTQTKVKTAEKKSSSSSLPPIDFRLRVQDEISRLNDSGNKNKKPNCYICCF